MGAVKTCTRPLVSGPSVEALDSVFPEPTAIREPSEDIAT